MSAKLREDISKILIKWSMPTRQVAINELVRLFDQYKSKKWIHRLHTIRASIPLTQGKQARKMVVDLINDLENEYKSK